MDIDANSATALAQKFGQINTQGDIISVILSTVGNWLGLAIELFKISWVAGIALLVEVWLVKYAIGHFGNIKVEGIVWWIISAVITLAFVFPLTAGIIFSILGGTR